MELQYWRSKKSPANPPLCVSCKVLAPVASEDVLAPANQGVMPEGLGLEFVAEADECKDSVPVAGTSNSDVAWAIQQQIWDSSIKKEEQVNASATLTSLKKDEPQQPPVAFVPTQLPAKANGVASKRKAVDDIYCSCKGASSSESGPLQEAKKPRCGNRIRIKRSKI
jgi:hypothetical protein